MMKMRIALALLLTSFATFPSGQVPVDPSTLPLVQPSDLQYAGGFRMPDETDPFIYGGTPIAFNPARRSLFVGTEGKRLAEISIPAPVIASSARELPAATLLQSFEDPTEGRKREVYVNPGDITLYGLLVHGDRLIGSATIYYDANNAQRVSHYARSLTLSQPSFSGWSRVWNETQQGLVSGWMASVPAEWQARLGGPAITGQCCIPIISRTSYGPAAFAFDPSRIGQPKVPAQPLLYYDANHTTLGRWEDQNPAFGIATRMGGVAIIAGTRTAMFIGTTGMGPACYGAGTPNKALVGKPDPDGEPWCYDPTDSNKGTHAYPYRFQVWAYDLNDFAAVKAGKKRPWDVKPYGLWPLTLPFPADQMLVGGVAYDAQTQTLYVSQKHADRGEYTARPVIHAFRITAGTTSSNPMPSAIVF
jgi:hypothetical protein